MRTAAQRVAGRDCSATPATVDAHLGRSADDRQGDALSGWENDRPDSEREWVHRHDEQITQRRLEDWTARRQRVGSRTGGRGHDHAIGVDHPHPLLADLDLDAQHARVLSPIHNHLVQPDRAGHAS